MFNAQRKIYLELQEAISELLNSRTTECHELLESMCSTRDALTHFVGMKVLNHVEKSASGPGLPDRSPGVALIEAERVRQIQNEGWNLAHDATHKTFELAKAAACYAANAAGIERLYPYHYADGIKSASLWPWGTEHDKRKQHDVKRSLVIAGALIAAELDRLHFEEEQDAKVHVTQEGQG